MYETEGFSFLFEINYGDKVAVSRVYLLKFVFTVNIYTLLELSRVVGSLPGRDKKKDGKHAVISPWLIQLHKL